jgi:hypothetical protein
MQKLINIVFTSSFSGIPQIRSSGIVCHNSLCCKSDKCTIVSSWIFDRLSKIFGMVQS